MDKSQKRKVVSTYILAIVMMFAIFYGIAFHVATFGVVAEMFGVDPTVLVNFLLAFASFIVILIYWLIFRRRKFKGVFSFKKCSKEVYIGLAIVVVVDTICLIVDGCLLEGGIKSLVMPTLTTFSISLAAGVYEETSFRAIPISIFMKNKPSSLWIYLAVLITAMGFALAHVGNISVGASVQITMLQVGSCFFTGIFLAAVYLRTGSILMPMCFHFYHDIINLMEPMQSTGVMLQQTITGKLLVFDIVLSSFELLVGIYLLRKSTHGDIKNRWADIWGEEPEAGSSSNT